MKKMLIAFVIAMIFMPMAVFAKMEPTPILLQVGDGLASGSYEVTITNLQTNSWIIQTTAEHGYLLYGSIETIPDLTIIPGQTLRFSIGTDTTYSAIDYTYIGTEEEINLVLPTSVAPTTTTTSTTTTTTTTIVPETTTTTTSTTTTTVAPVCPATDVSLYTGAILLLVFGFLIKKYAPYNDKIRATHYLDSKKRRKLKIEKYEKYQKADGTTGYRWKVVSDVFA